MPTKQRELGPDTPLDRLIRLLAEMEVAKYTREEHGHDHARTGTRAHNDNTYRS